MKRLPHSVSNNKNYRGFTLIELIVTITVVAVLSTVAMISFGATNKKARDGRRASDIQKVAIALEMARQVGGTYPVSSAGQAPSLVTAGYLQKWPDDPKTYLYYYQRPTNYTYTISAYMEDLGSTNGTGNYGNNCAAPGNCNYQVANP